MKKQRNLMEVHEFNDMQKQMIKRKKTNEIIYDRR